MSTTPPPAAELPESLETALRQIRAALLPGADEAMRAAAANVCHALARVFEAKPAGAASPSATPAATPPAPIDQLLARILATFGGTPAAPSAAAPALLDQVLARVVESFGADLGPDPTVPYLNLGQAASVMGLGRAR